MYNVFTNAVPAAVINLTGTGTSERCIVLGMDSILTCTFTPPTEFILWFKIINDTRVHVFNSREYVVTNILSALTSQLTIRDVASEDVGIYGCEVLNSVNGTTSSHSLEVDFVICSK